MGLWQKLLDWLRPAPHGMPPEAGREPAFTPEAEPDLPPQEAAAQPPAPAPRAKADSVERRLSKVDATVAAQPDLFDADFTHEANDASSTQQQALQNTLSMYAGMAWERQMDFANQVQGLPWTADIGKGHIQFGTDLRFTMQVLGTYTRQGRTWQWIWADSPASPDSAHTEVARQLQAFGNAQGLSLLSQPSSEVDEAQLHQIGLIASGADESVGYFLGPYDDHIFLALIDPGHGLPIQQPRPERALAVVSDLISSFELNHRLLLQHYLSAKGFSLQETPTHITAQQGKTRIVATLDAQGCITALEG